MRETEIVPLRKSVLYALCVFAVRLQGGLLYVLHE